jgi:hypothetical protein
VTRRRELVVAAMTGAMLACGGPRAEPARMPASGTMMTGDSMTMMATPLIPDALARLDSLESADSTVRAIALAHHVTALPTLLKAIQTDLMHMGMHRDSAYEALVDSVRRDAAGSLASAEATARLRRALSGYTAMVGKGKRG